MENKITKKMPLWGILLIIGLVVAIIIMGFMINEKNRSLEWFNDNTVMDCSEGQHSVCVDYSTDWIECNEQDQQAICVERGKYAVYNGQWAYECKMNEMADCLS